MKTAKTRQKKSGSLPCFECAGGTLRPILQDYETKHAKLGKVTIPAVPMLRCDHCGAVVIGDDGNRRIDAWLDKALNAISTAEIQSFLGKYHLTQKQASELTGLGEKNISRWLSGRARPSESVSNFLRVLLAEPSAFERLRSKDFLEAPKAVPTPAHGLPDAEEKKLLKLVDYPTLVKLGKVQPATGPVAKRSELCRMLGVADLKTFRSQAEAKHLAIAAFKDTRQRSNWVSGAIWIELGCQVASRMDVKPYDRDKLRASVDQLRKLTQSPLAQVIPQVRQILAETGVALVFMPLMKESAFRGCTRLLGPQKATIIHSLKYRTVSQFWLILFHEIAHLVLHISDVEDVFPEYEDRQADLREAQADEWAQDTLVYSDKLIAFRARHEKPKPLQVDNFAREIGIHTAIAAEVINKKAGSEVIQYGLLKKMGLFPHLSNAEVESFWVLNESAPS